MIKFELSLSERGRVPGSVFYLAVFALLLGGCSGSVDRFQSSSFDDGYRGFGHQSGGTGGGNANSAGLQPAASYTDGMQAAGSSYNSRPRVQLANAGGYGQPASGGYLQVARVDLPEVQQPKAAAPSRLQYADGYGRGNKGPLPDGVYSGPRAITPYGNPYGPEGHRPAPHSGFHGSNMGPGEGRRNGHGGKGHGKIVTVQTGETLYTLAIRHGVTVGMIMQANGLPSQHVKSGQEIIIPAIGPVSYAVGAPEPRPVSMKGDGASYRCERSGDCHTVQRGETLGSIAKLHGVPALALLEANGLADPRQIKPGHILTIPQPPEARATHPEDVRAPSASRTKERIALADNKQLPGAANGAHSQREAVRSAEEITAAPPPAQPAADIEPETRTAALNASQPLVDGHSKSCDAALANPIPRSGKTFRKPVEGMVIGQFGAQKDGSVNEGITISVPKGTPIKAAENGVVAYVGNELAGFGNLVLIRHADDYVTAYAHAEEISVQRCDIIKRGQVIAKAGATGDVKQPQLHFEIRRAAKPLDPAPLLSS